MVSARVSDAEVGRRSPGLFSRLRFLRWVLIAVLVVLVAAGVYYAYTRLTAPAAPPVPPQTVAVRKGTLTSTVSSTGTVTPLTQAKLSFRASGRIAEVNVKPGDAVTKGQALAKLDTTDLALQLSQSKASLSTAQAKLANIKAGSRSEDLKAAQSQLDAAKSRLDVMLAGGRPEDIASAKASLDSAKAKLTQLQAPATDADVKAAQQAVVAAQGALQKAQNDLATLKAGATAEDIAAAELALEQAKTSLWSQQISRDGTCSQGKGYQCQSANASVANAELGVTAAQTKLASLQQPPKPEDVAAAEQTVKSAEAQLASAQAKLQQVKAGPTAGDLAQAQAAVTQAEQALVLKQKPYTDADIQAQRQAVAQAEAALVAKQAPYTDADVLSAQAAVDQAQAQYDLAEFNLANATLTAPFDGTIGTVGLNLGEVASGSSTISLVNVKDLRLDVSVDETDVAKVQPGQRVDVTFDAMPGQAIQGKVTAVAPTATIQSGVATYLISISLTNPGQVKAGMTGNASIVYGEQQNVLMVPNRAVRTQGRNRVVDVLVNGKTETRQVKVGVANDQMTEITEGVAEGDQAVISATRSTIPGAGGPGGGPVMVRP